MRSRSGSPIGLHFEQGMQAIQAGKHIHFNKTMTTTADEATQLIDAAAAAGVKMVASPGQMIRPANKRIRKMIQDGRPWAAGLGGNRGGLRQLP